MDKTAIAVLITIFVYLAAMVVIGIMCSKKNKSADDFYLGGRKLGPLVTAMSAEASDMSSWLLMGLPGVAYLTGIAEAFWTALGLAIGTWVNWLVVSKRIRRYSQKIDAITIPDFFSKRYKDTKNLLSFVAALVILVFFIPYTASGFAACGKLFKSLFNVDYHQAMIICAVIIVVYTTLGGFIAASTTDFIQSIIMTIALVVVLGFGTAKAGGFGEVVDNAKNLAGYLSLKDVFSPVTGTSASYGGVLAIVSTLAWGLGYFGMPHILLRFMAARDEKKLTLSRRVATVWVVISMGLSIVIGMVGLGMTKAGVLPSLQGANSETVIVEIANVLRSNGVLPAIVAGLILAGILAATMSTADSQLLAASSSVSQNLVTDFFKIKMSNKVSVIVARATVVVISIIAVFLAWNPDSSVFKIVSFAWAGFGAAFGPVMLLALFWKRSNMAGALAGMVTGGVMVFLWKYVISKLGGAFAIYELLPAFVLALIVNIVVSLCTKAPDKEIQDIFDEVKNPVVEETAENM